MNYQITCLNCTFINNIKDISQKTCNVCNNPLPELNDIQIFNIMQANQRQLKIYDNIKKARDFIPETYFKSPSIFITGKINGHSVKFLIDTGAQMSVISKDIAFACNLDEIIDEAYCGKIMGVGNDTIMGRVHYVEVMFDWGILPCGFTVCKNPNLVPIIGIDILNSHGVIIDFKNKSLQIGNNKINW